MISRIPFFFLMLARLEYTDMALYVALGKAFRLLGKRGTLQSNPRRPLHLLAISRETRKSYVIRVAGRRCIHDLTPEIRVYTHN